MLAGMRLKNWRKNADDMVGKPDVVFSQEHIAIFIDGCFWHGCPHCDRKLPQTNREYWERKIHRNIELAKQYNRKLKKAGWKVLRIWEHEIRNPAERKRVREKIRQAIKQAAENQ
jgi:DNA mismatch endonuclease (patch repair protein)